MKLFFKMFGPYLFRYRWVLILSYTSSAIAAAISLSVGWLVRERLDPLLDSPDILELSNLYLLLAFCIILAHAVVSFVQTYSMVWFGTRIATDIRTDIFQKVLMKGEALVDNESSGQLQTRLVADTTAFSGFLSVTLPSIFVSTLLFVGASIAAVFISPELSGTVFAGLAITVLPIVLTLNKFNKMGQDTQHTQAVMGRRAGETFRNLSIVHTFNQQEKEISQFGVIAESLASVYLKMMRLQTSINVSVYAGAFAVLSIAAWMGSRLVFKNQLSAGDLIAFAIYLGMVINYGIQLVVSVINVGLVSGQTKKLGEILQLPSYEKFSSGCVIEAPLQIELKNFNYHYPSRPNDNALKNINLVIEPGKRISFVGASGSGKSTLFKAIMSLFEPSSGEMFGNNVSSTEYSIENWREQFGFVPQALYLISGSVTENIAYGVKDATEEEILNAARLAHAHEFIINLPQGYDTDLGEVGDRLSGGQKQRISLARAILKSPSIYLLDEATSSLDAETEMAIENTLASLSGSSSVLIIAHRLHMVKNADKVVVMEQGRIIAVGEHEQLLASQPTYQKLIASYRP